ncbi:MAG: hypothetical protein U0350_17010 [Caldilineaceae bacterium]
MTKDKAKALIQEFPGEAAYKALAEGKAWVNKAKRLQFERAGKAVEVEITPAPLTWWGLKPTPTEISPSLGLDYL